MKYCPYCGSELINKEAAFCPECGKALMGADEKQKQSSEERNEELNVPEQEIKSRKKKAIQKSSKQKRKKGTRRVDEKESPTQQVDKQSLKKEDDYDGYYDDVLPMDEGSHREGLDKTLVKKIVVLAIGALLIVAACVALMYLL